MRSHTHTHTNVPVLRFLFSIPFAAIGRRYLLRSQRVLERVCVCVVQNAYFHTQNTLEVDFSPFQVDFSIWEREPTKKCNLKSKLESRVNFTPILFGVRKLKAGAYYCWYSVSTHTVTHSSWKSLSLHYGRRKVNYNTPTCSFISIAERMLLNSHVCITVRQNKRCSKRSMNAHNWILPISVYPNIPKYGCSGFVSLAIFSQVLRRINAVWAVHCCALHSSGFSAQR